MSRPSNPVPTYRHHKQSGQAIVTLPDGLGGRRDVLLGTYGTKASRSEYSRVMARWEASGRRLSNQYGVSVNELAVAFLKHAEQHYRHPDGTPTNEVVELKMCLRPVVHLHGHAPATEFGPLALRAVRQIMIDGYDHPKYGPQAALARGVVNSRTNRIRRAFKWGVANELVPASVLHALQAVTGLQRGRTEARETEPVRPVDPDVVEQTLPFLNRHLATMVRLQQLTGMRPGEVCIFRACDIETTGDVWLYRPAMHKTQHHGRQRVVALGPRAQELIRPFLKLDTQAYLFDPREAEAERRAHQRKVRKTKVQPSQRDRRKKKPAKTAGEHYPARSYHQAIYVACDLAFPPPEHLRRGTRENGQPEGYAAWIRRLTPQQRDELRAWRREHHWSPNQLRHSHGTEVRRRFGLEAAQVSLGHAQANITEVYAERDLGLAVKVAAEIG